MAIINQKPSTIPDAQEIASEEVTAEAALEAAVQWIGRQFRSVRIWKGSDGREYASISHTNANPNNGVHKDPMDVAEAVLAAKSNTREFATFQLKFNGQNANARLIKADRVNNALICALDMEYTVNAVSSAITAFASKKPTADAGAQIEMGFGAF